MRIPPRSPVLARPDGSVQIGLAAPAIVDRLKPAERAFVASLEGGRAVTTVETTRFRDAIAALERAEAWDPGQSTPFAQPRVLIRGAGRAGVTIGTMIARAGLSVGFTDTAPCSVEPVGTYDGDASGTCAGAAVATLGRLGLVARLDPRDIDLEIVLCVGAPDATVTAGLMASGTAHLVVAADESGAWVSGIIVPGSTPCVRCRDLALTREDDHWPLLALQAASRRPALAPIVEAAVAALVIDMVERWVTHGEHGSGTYVGPRGSTSAKAVAAAPTCGCGAAGPVGDEVAAQRAAMPRT